MRPCSESYSPQFDVGLIHVELAIAASHIVSTGEARGMKNVMKTKTIRVSEQIRSMLTILSVPNLGGHAVSNVGTVGMSVHVLVLRAVPRTR